MSRKPPGYWDDWKNVEEALRPVIARLGRFPTRGEVCQLPSGFGISSAIQRKGGYHAMARDMHLEAVHFPSGHWQRWENVEAALRALIKKHGRLPSRRKLNALGESTLVQAITKYHGGTTAVCKRLGVTLGQQPSGYWKTWANVESKFRELTKTFGHFPTYGDLNRKEYRGLLSGVRRYHGGMESVRQKMKSGPPIGQVLDRYADQIAEAFIRDHGDAASFEDFLATLERDCRYERDLRVRLGLPPEPETD